MLEVLTRYRGVAVFVQPCEHLPLTESSEQTLTRDCAESCPASNRDPCKANRPPQLKSNQTSLAYSGDLNSDMDIVGSKARLLVMSALPTIG